EQAHAVMDKARLSQQARDLVQQLAGELHSRPRQTASLDEAPVTQDDTASVASSSAEAPAASAVAVVANTTQTVGSTPAPLSRPIVTAVSTAPQQAAPAITPSSPFGFQQAPLMERYSPLVR